MPETIHAHLQGRSLCLEHVSPVRSKCVCLGLRFWTWKARGEFFDVLVDEGLCGVACCMGSGIVVLKYSAIQQLMLETKQLFVLNNVSLSDLH